MDTLAAVTDVDYAENTPVSILATGAMVVVETGLCGLRNEIRSGLFPL